MRPLRIGVAGLGFGADVHLPVLLGFPDVTVVGLLGRSNITSSKVSGLYGVPVFDSIQELLNLDLDAVTLALPPTEIADVVKPALHRGVAILCEKPLGPDASHLEALSRLGRAKVTMVDFIFAELDVFMRLKRIIDDQTLGRLRYANLLWLTESWAHQNGTWSWKTDARRYGGVITLLGAHIFYLAEWLFGPASSVHANISSRVSSKFAPIGEVAAEDLVECRFRHDNQMTLNCTFGNANPGIAVHRWTVVFENASVILENTSKDYTAFKLYILKRDQPCECHTEPASSIDGRIAPFTKLARRFVDAARGGYLTYPDFRAGARVHDIELAVRKSAFSHEEVAT